MQATRQFWATAAIGLLFSLLAIGGDQPVALIGVAGIGVWLIATSWTAVRSFQHLDETLEIEYALDPSTTYVDTPATVSLTVTRPEGSASTRMQVSPRLPAGLRRTTETAPSLTLGAGETEATVTVPLHADVAGEFTLPAPTVSLTDTFELYTEQLSRGPQPKLTVLPQTPTVHIGKGGKPYGNAFGEHSTDQPGPGIATRDLRQYIVGEDAMNIDWKSTARLGEPYVRETEGETDRHTALLVDHRAHTGESATEETPLEYIREAALAMTASAVGHSDPLSLWTVGDDGLTETLAAGSTPAAYTRVRSTLLGLTPTASATDHRPAPTRRIQTVIESLDVETPARQTLQRYGTGATAVKSVREDAFVDAVYRARTQIGAGMWLVLVTNDADPMRLRESIKLATQGGTEVLVLIVPTVLFQRAHLETITEAYDAYTEFEQLRRELDSHPRVTALEVAPGDRLRTLLSVEQSERHKPEAR